MLLTHVYLLYVFILVLLVLDEEDDRILNMGVHCHFGQAIDSMKELMEQNFDAYFIGTGAPRGRDLELTGREDVNDYIHIGIDWLSSVAFGHIAEIKGKVIVMGGGNTCLLYTSPSPRDS